jgi:hypothetical protein
MTSFEDVNLSARHLLPITAPVRRDRRTSQVIPAPDHQQPRLPLAHPRLRLRIGVYIGPIVVKQVALNLCLGWLRKTEFVGPKIGIIAFHVRIVSDMAQTRGNRARSGDSGPKASKREARTSVQREKRPSVFRTGLSIEDRQPRYLYRAIKGGVLHRTFLSLRLGQSTLKQHKFGDRKCPVKLRTSLAVPS